MGKKKPGEHIISNVYKLVLTMLSKNKIYWGCPFHCELNNALLIMPVASIYRSTHLEMQLLSLPPRLEPGFVTHFSKHFLPTVCKIKVSGIVADETLNKIST